MSPAAPIPRLAPLALWQVAQAFLGTLQTLFGAPETIAARQMITAKTHALLASWLRAGEAMLRRLLLIEASLYPKPNTRPLLRPARRRAPRQMLFSADAPESWRVRFRCFAAPTRRHIQRRAARAAARSVSDSVTPPLRSAWPLAERYEALIRVFNDPAAYARRLARRLHATPHRLAELTRAPPEAEHRIDRFEAMGEQARTLWRPHFESG